MTGSGCQRSVRLFGLRLFTLTGGKHKWDRDVEAIPDTVLFQRVNCVRCGFAIDGVALKRVIEQMPSMKRSLV